VAIEDSKRRMEFIWRRLLASEEEGGLGGGAALASEEEEEGSSGAERVNRGVDSSPRK
jgi:hypothetical protein